jgi:type II secretion system protein G
MKKQDKGFTLVELLIVIVILGILATVTVFAVTGITGRGKETACKADRKTLATALESYAADTGGYPTSATTWQADLQSAGLLSDSSASTNFTYAHTAEVPDDPATPANEFARERFTLTGVADCVGL